MIQITEELYEDLKEHFNMESDSLTVLNSLENHALFKLNAIDTLEGLYESLESIADKKILKSLDAVVEALKEVDDIIRNIDIDTEGVSANLLDRLEWAKLEVHK